MTAYLLFTEHVILTVSIKFYVTCVTLYFCARIASTASYALNTASPNWRQRLLWWWWFNAKIPAKAVKML